MTLEQKEVNSHAKWLRRVGENLYEQQRDYSIANTCEEAADEIDRLEAQISALKELGQRIDDKLAAAEADARRITDSTLFAAWIEIDNHVKRGPLQGNGCDETAQRNGMIMAQNILMNLRKFAASERDAAIDAQGVKP